MLKKLTNNIGAKLKTNLVKNSFWGIFSNIFQNILFSVFFIIVARYYTKSDFAAYIIANTLYATVVGFASLGLGNWFIRELINTDNKSALIDKFFKIQLYVGIIFYGVNVLLAFALYDSQLIRNLSLLIGINVIFDNVIYVIKFINVAQYEQKKTFVVLTVEAVLKFLIACALFIHPIPIIYLSFFLIALRLVTLNLFIKFGSSGMINLRHILTVKVSMAELKTIIGKNWSFVIIASISVIYWRIGSIIVSKVLNDADVANYEVSFKLFSLAEILPVIVSTSIYPLLINAHKKSLADMAIVYKRAFIAYALFGLLAFTFIYSYADFFVPWLFGKEYVDTVVYCQQMFLTILVFPTALLQANVMITLKLERLDMWGNVGSLVVNLILCAVFFQYVRTLSVINYAIFFSFLAFHLMQDVVLIRRKLATIAHVCAFYLISAAIVASYYLLTKKVDPYWLFFIFWTIVGATGLAIFAAFNKNKGQPLSLNKLFGKSN